MMGVWVRVAVVAAATVVPGTMSLLLPDGFVALNSTEGQRLLFGDSTVRESFVSASVHHVTQIDTGSCFRASASIVLNALTEFGVEAPIDPRYGNRNPYFTQDNVVAAPCATAACGYHKNCVGVPLDDGVAALNCSAGVEVRGLHAMSTGLSNSRQLGELLEETLSFPGGHVIVNFIGKDAMNGLVHGGHYSPVVAFNKRTRQALVLDVSRYKYPPWWVSLDQLWSGINTRDSTGPMRGVIVLTT